MMIFSNGVLGDMELTMKYRDVQIVTNNGWFFEEILAIITKNSDIIS